MGLGPGSALLKGMSGEEAEVSKHEPFKKEVSF